MVGDLEDPRRSEPTFQLNERATLEGWLEFHRVTLLLKCEGLSDAERKARPVATSKLSLHGLVRHMAEVERGWFQRVFGNDRDVASIWYDDAIEDSELVPLDDAVWEDDLAVWQGECAASRVAAEGRSLEDVGTHSHGPCSLRWIYTHMIEEYARHNGHADLLREMLDGSVGY